MKSGRRPRPCPSPWSAWLPEARRLVRPGLSISTRYIFECARMHASSKPITPVPHPPCSALRARAVLTCAIFCCAGPSDGARRHRARTRRVKIFRRASLGALSPNPPAGALHRTALVHSARVLTALHLSCTHTLALAAPPRAPVCPRARPSLTRPSAHPANAVATRALPHLPAAPHRQTLAPRLTALHSALSRTVLRANPRHSPACQCRMTAARFAQVSECDPTATASQGRGVVRAPAALVLGADRGGNGTRWRCTRAPAAREPSCVMLALHRPPPFAHANPRFRLRRMSTAAPTHEHSSLL